MAWRCEGSANIRPAQFAISLAPVRLKRQGFAAGYRKTDFRIANIAVDDPGEEVRRSAWQQILNRLYKSEEVSDQHGKRWLHITRRFPSFIYGNFSRTIPIVASA